MKEKKKRCINCQRANIPLSRKGLCPECQIKRQDKAWSEMINKEGAAYDRWLESMSIAIERLKQEREDI